MTLLTLLGTTALAAPTLTQARSPCRCELVSAPALETPASAHWSPTTWSPADPTPSASPYRRSASSCSALGPELELFRVAKPELYEAYVRDKIATTSLLAPDALAPDAPLPTEILMHGGERIRCYAAPDSLPAYNDTCATLWGLQMIVAATILACVAEAVHLALRWFWGRARAPCEEDECGAAETAQLRLPGGERLLLAIPAAGGEKSDAFSPGADKKMRAYEATRYFVVKSSSGRREFVAYDSEDDDEANRPVM
ncbi:hypothetical protein EJ07DRAFT_92661 [Lizonia empirigonia]|nr:hypothetical protein EJ07DRAFT_92661 [Lizonia empirigonia]